MGNETKWRESQYLGILLRVLIKNSATLLEDFTERLLKLSVGNLRDYV